MVRQKLAPEIQAEAAPHEIAGEAAYAVREFFRDVNGVRFGGRESEIPRDHRADEFGSETDLSISNTALEFCNDIDLLARRTATQLSWLRKASDLRFQILGGFEAL